MYVLQGLKCRSHGCQQQGLRSQDGYCNSCYGSKAEAKNSVLKKFDFKDYKHPAFNVPARGFPVKNSSENFK